MLKCHSHGKNTGTDTAVVRHLVTEDGAAGGIHDEPDICFDAADFDIGFIGSKYFAGFVIIAIDKGFDTDGCSFAVVGDLLVGDADVIKVFESLRGFS